MARKSFRLAALYFRCAPPNLNRQYSADLDLVYVAAPSGPSSLKKLVSALTK